MGNSEMEVGELKMGMGEWGIKNWKWVNGKETGNG